MESYSTDPQTFYFAKPPTWKHMALWEKLSYYKNILNEEYAPYVDKLTAKQIVKQLGGDRIQVANTIRILDSPDDLRQEDLQTNYMIKASHGSGWNINVQPTTNLDECKTLLKQWNIPYKGIASGESQYQYLQPRFFIEEKINDMDTGVSGEATVYMFRCIQGTVTTISIRRGNVQNMYDVNLQPLEPEKFTIKRPSNLHSMIYLAEKLASPFEFVRVDFYLSVDKKIYFSEFTFTPAGGSQMLSNQLEKYYGALWK